MLRYESNNDTIDSQRITNKEEAMTDCENIAAQIGEFVYVEMDDIKNVEYCTNENKEQTSFVITANNEKEFIVEIKPK